MEIIVCIKQVPGTSEVEVDPETGVLKRDGIESKMNPYDLYAVEASLRLKEQRGGSVQALSMGPPQAEAVLREAYMMGVDEAVLLSDRRFAGSDVLATAYTLSQGIRAVGIPDLIICGEQTTDGDTAQVGPELAEFLSIPHVTNVRSISAISEGAVTVEMEMPFAVETVEVAFPCLIAVEKGIYQPRLPSWVRKQATADRPVTVLGLEDLEDRSEARYGLTGSPTQVKRIFPPEVHDDHELIEAPGDELAALLYERLISQKFISAVGGRR